MKTPRNCRSATWNSHFFGTARAPPSHATLCERYTTETSITPWSGTPVSYAHPQVFRSPLVRAGRPCSNPLPFAPGFQAGTTNVQAGSFTPFTLTMTRPDGDQTLSEVSMHMPPGLLGHVLQRTVVRRARANAGTCGEESLIGHTVVSAGMGHDPYTVTGGKVYITLLHMEVDSMVWPSSTRRRRAHLSSMKVYRVIVRASINVDPYTAALTVTSGPLPAILDGIPLQIQRVNVTVERPGGFVLNPTIAIRWQSRSRSSSSEGLTARGLDIISGRELCAPWICAEVRRVYSWQNEKANGASLAAKLTYPTGPSYANIAKVKVDLPKQLPSRLTTLQKACLAKVFDANPAQSSSRFDRGHASAITR